MVILQLDEQPPLIQAIFAGEVDEVKSLLEYKQDVNCLDCEKRTPLHAAAYKGDAVIASLLLLHGARVNAKDGKWLTPLHRACCTGSDETVSLLLRYQADISARDKLWQTPLHIASANDAFMCVAQLLDNIPNTNVTDRAGRTALHHASFNGHTYVAELLISKGCIVNACDKKDCRPLHCAAHMGHIDTVDLLLRNDADINARDRNQYTPLHVAAASGMENVCRLLLNTGAQVDAQNSYGNTPLHIACLNGHLSICQELLAYNANIEATNYRGQTPLHIAAASTHGVDCLMFLLEQKININKQSLDGRTPLHMTAIHGRFTRSKTLIDRGAVVDCTDKNGCTALHIAAQYGHELLANTLLSFGADPQKRGYEGRTPLHMCCLSGHVECCRKFIQAGVDLNAQDATGKTATHCAAYEGSVECLDLLVSSGANFQLFDNIQRIALHYAAVQGHFQCVFTLVSIGSQVNAADLDGCTSLHLAAAYDMEGKCVEYLIHHKADPKIKDNNGFTPIHYAVCGGNLSGLIHLLAALGNNYVIHGPNMPLTTPLHLAAKSGNLDILRLILPYFPDTNIKSVNGITPLMLAAKEGHPNCVQMLLRFGAKVAIINDTYDMTAMHYSAKNGHMHCLALLLDNTEDKSVIDVKDRLQRTALMLAVSGNHNECVLNLLKSGANPNIIDGELHSSLFRAVVAGQNSIVQLLLTKNANVAGKDIHGKTVLHLAAACGHFACLQTIVQQMKEEEAIALDNQECTALHWACYNGNANCLEYLLHKEVFKTMEGNLFSPVHCATFVGSEKCLDLLCKYYGSTIVQLTDSRRRQPLHIAALHGHADCAKFLLEQGAQTEVKDDDSRTPFIAAAQYGQSQIIELLITYNAEKTSYDKNGNTALHWACMKKHSHTALLLLEYVDCSDIVNMVNNEHKTPLHLAARNGLVDVTRQLIQKGASVLATDAEGLTPALCCAPTKEVAQCLATILKNYPQFINLNSTSEKDKKVNSSTSSLSLYKNLQKQQPKIKKLRTQKLQTQISLMNNPDFFECQRLFDVKLPSQLSTNKFHVSKNQHQQYEMEILNKMTETQIDDEKECFIIENYDLGKEKVEEEKLGLDLHKSHSDMYIAYKGNEEVLNKSVNNKQKKKDILPHTTHSFVSTESTSKICFECIKQHKKCADCTMKKLFKQHHQGKINKQEFQYLLLKTCCEGSSDYPNYVSKMLDDLGKTYVKSMEGIYNEEQNKKDEDAVLTKNSEKRKKNVKKDGIVKKPISSSKEPGKLLGNRHSDINCYTQENQLKKLNQYLNNPVTKKIFEDIAKSKSKTKINDISTKKNEENKTHTKTTKEKIGVKTKKTQSKKGILNIEMPLVGICDDSDDSDLPCNTDGSTEVQQLFTKQLDIKPVVANKKIREDFSNENLKILESCSDDDVIKVENVVKTVEKHEMEERKIFARKNDLLNMNSSKLQTVDGASVESILEKIQDGLELIKNTDYINRIADYVQKMVVNAENKESKKFTENLHICYRSKEKSAADSKKCNSYRLELTDSSTNFSKEEDNYVKCQSEGVQSDNLQVDFQPKMETKDVSRTLISSSHTSIESAESRRRSLTFFHMIPIQVNMVTFDCFAHIPKTWSEPCSVSSNAALDIRNFEPLDSSTGWIYHNNCDVDHKNFDVDPKVFDVDRENYDVDYKVFDVDHENFDVDHKVFDVDHKNFDVRNNVEVTNCDVDRNSHNDVGVSFNISEQNITGNNSVAIQSDIPKKKAVIEKSFCDFTEQTIENFSGGIKAIKKDVMMITDKMLQVDQVTTENQPFVDAIIVSIEKQEVNENSFLNEIDSQQVVDTASINIEESLPDMTEKEKYIEIVSNSSDGSATEDEIETNDILEVTNKKSLRRVTFTEGSEVESVKNDGDVNKQVVADGVSDQKVTKKVKKSGSGITLTKKKSVGKNKESSCVIS